MTNTVPQSGFVDIGLRNLLKSLRLGGFVTTCIIFNFDGNKPGNGEVKELGLVTYLVFTTYHIIIHAIQNRETNVTLTYVLIFYHAFVPIRWILPFHLLVNPIFANIFIAQSQKSKTPTTTEPTN